MNLTNRKESTQDRILGIFEQFSNPLSGEEVVLLFEEQYGRNGTSDVVRTGISALTRKGLLREAGEVVSPTTKEPVKTWTRLLGGEAPAPVVTLRKNSKASREERLADFNRLDQKLQTLKGLLLKQGDDGFLASYIDDVQTLTCQIRLSLSKDGDI